MKDLKLYNFRDVDFLRIGKLLADRDTFVVFFHLAHCAGSSNIAQLAGSFRREPAVITEILKQLVALGLLRGRGGLYTLTNFGRSVMEFLEESTAGVQLKAAQTSAVPHLLSLDLRGMKPVDPSATNNSVVSTFAVTSWVTSKNPDIESAKSTDTVSYSQAERFENREPSPRNGARTHNYL